MIFDPQIMPTFSCEVLFTSPSNINKYLIPASILSQLSAATFSNVAMREPYRKGEVWFQIGSCP